MLKIVVTSPILDGREITRDKNLLNNPEWLRAQDRRNATIYVCPYYDTGYFRQEIIEPFINHEDSERDGYLNEDMLGVEWYKDGINYIVQSEGFLGNPIVDDLIKKGKIR